jgi:predicted nuclease of predicted toxin-antitoxin system
MPLSFLVDEDLPQRLVDALMASGRVATHVRDAGLTSQRDEAVYKYAVANGFTLITADVEFGSVLIFPLGAHHGIVLTRLPNEMPNALAVQRIVAVLSLLAEDDVRGNVIVIDERRTRIRRKP